MMRSAGRWAPAEATERFSRRVCTLLDRLKANMDTKFAKMDRKFAKFDNKFAKMDTKLNTLSENTVKVIRRLDLMAPVLATEQLKPYVLKLFGKQAASGILGGTWTMLGCGGRCFAVSALHVVDCFKARDEHKVYMVLPPLIAKAATAVGVYDRALTTLDGGSNIPNHVDVLVVEVDIAKLPKKVQANVLDINPAGSPHAGVEDGTLVVGWSEQMPLSGRALGAKDGVVYIAEGEGCVGGNSGTCVFRVVNGEIDKDQPLGVYVATSSNKRGVVVPLPRKFPKVTSRLSAPMYGKFQMVCVRAVEHGVLVSTRLGREVSPLDLQLDGIELLRRQRTVELDVSASVYSKFCTSTAGARAARRGEYVGGPVDVRPLPARPARKAGTTVHGRKKR